MSLVAAGCGGAGTAGLSNAPGGTKPWGSEDRGQEPIANGQGSCPSEGSDPLPHRNPPCAEASSRPVGPVRQTPPPPPPR